ncbi:MAG: hypothetical protein WKF70_11840, partial [Chitinophagaceae bacterium]
PDLYDTDYTSEGIGNWCLMAGGSWNNGGLTPAHPSAWCKCQQGWVSTINQSTNQSNVAIEDVKSGYNVFRMWKNGAASNEYFLVENRQKTLFDKFIPASGLLVWHIDDSVPNNSDEAHYKVALMQADGKKDLELNNNRGDAGDIFPGSTAKKSFTIGSNPNSKSYAGANTYVSITNISNNASTMYADLKVKSRTKPAIKKNKTPVKFQMKDVVSGIMPNGMDDINTIKEESKTAEWVNRGVESGISSSLEKRLSNLEAIVSYIRPYLGQSFREDILSADAYINEEDFADDYEEDDSDHLDDEGERISDTTSFKEGSVEKEKKKVDQDDKNQ